MATVFYGHGLGRKAGYKLGYFEPQEKRSAQLNVRVPKSVQDSLRDLARLWTEMEKARTEEEDSEVTISDVAVRLLQVGLDGAWAEAGGRPETEVQWKALLGVVTKKFAKK